MHILQNVFVEMYSATGETYFRVWIRTWDGNGTFHVISKTGANPADVLAAVARLVDEGVIVQEVIFPPKEEDYPLEVCTVAGLVALSRGIERPNWVDKKEIKA